jgi:IS30 family transposase
MKHMWLSARIEIYTKLGLWETQENIAIFLWYKQSSISKEISKWKKDWKYDPIHADNLAKNRRKTANVTRTKLLKGNLWAVIEWKLKDSDEDWSPDTIIGQMKVEWLKLVCEKTIYNFIHNHSPWTKVLLRHWRKWYRKRGEVEKRWTIWNILRIDQRPQEVELRETATHWEADTIISWTRKTRLVTLVERKSRYICIKKTSSGQALEVSQCIIDMGVEIWIDKFESITSDNGKEFANWEMISYMLQSLFFFAFPYHSRERGTNENGNRCIRKHLPKWFEFESLSDSDIEKLQRKLNNKPRKILNYRSPAEVLFGEKLTYFSHYSF